MQIIFEAIGGTYRQEGAYSAFRSDSPGASTDRHFGRVKEKIYYLWDHKSGLYTGMLLEGTLNTDLEEVGTVASAMFDRSVEQMKKA